jgi:hypothetical protein
MAIISQIGSKREKVKIVEEQALCSHLGGNDYHIGTKLEEPRAARRVRTELS